MFFTDKKFLSRINVLLKTVLNRLPALEMANRLRKPNVYRIPWNSILNSNFISAIVLSVLILFSDHHRSQGREIVKTVVEGISGRLQVE